MTGDLNMSEQSTYMQASQLQNMSMDHGKGNVLDFSQEQMRNISYIKEHVDTSKVDYGNELIFPED